jgi:hypothetical protein
VNPCQIDLPQTWILFHQKELRKTKSLSEQGFKLSAIAGRFKDLTSSRVAAQIINVTPRVMDSLITFI